MKLNIRGNKIKVTTAIKSYIEDKFSRLDKYFKEKEVDVNVLIKVNGLEQIIEVTIPGNKLTIRSEERNRDLYAAIDLVTDKLERQIRKNKTRLAKQYKDNSDLQLVLDEIEEIKSLTNEKIIKRKDIELKPMNEAEALLQMDLLNHDFFLFKNIDEDCFSVIYRRKDGEYGIIDAK